MTDARKVEILNSTLKYLGVNYWLNTAPRSATHSEMSYDPELHVKFARILPVTKEEFDEIIWPLMMDISKSLRLNDDLLKPVKTHVRRVGKWEQISEREWRREAEEIMELTTDEDPNSFVEHKFL